MRRPQCLLAFSTNHARLVRSARKIGDGVGTMRDAWFGGVLRRGVAKHRCASVGLAQLPGFTHLSDSLRCNSVADFAVCFLSLDPLIAKQGQLESWPIGQIDRPHPFTVPKIFQKLSVVLVEGRSQVRTLSSEPDYGPVGN